MKKKNSIQICANEYINNPTEKNFTILFYRLAPAMRKYIYGYIKDYTITEYAVINAFANIWLKIKQYNPDYAFSTWAYRIARNEALMILNKNNENYSLCAMTEMGIDMESKCPELKLDPDYEFFGLDSEQEISKLYDTVLDEIKTLPENYMTVLDLRLVKRMKLNEIAEETQWPLNTVKTRLRKALSIVEGKVKRAQPELVANFSNK